MDMTPERWRTTCDYLVDVFGREPAALEKVREAAAEAGLPAIAVSADVGRLLELLVRTTAAQRILEVGTLGGYSALWLARGLASDGELVTIEMEPEVARFAREQFAGVGATRIEVREGAALQVLEALQSEWEPGSVDVCFLDADKLEYPDYWKLVRDLIAPGGLLLADNVIGSGDWWIDQIDSPHRQAVDRFNRTVAADPSFDVAAAPIREGVLIARRRA